MALTAKQEQFARAVALESLSHFDAYSKVYDVSKMKQSSIGTAASALAGNDAVAARIAVLKGSATAVAVKKAGYTLADAIAEANELVELGKALGQTSAAVAASKLKSQLAGHLVEKKEIRTGSLEEDDLNKLKALRDEIDARIKHKQDAAAVTGEPLVEEKKVGNGVTRRVY